MKIILEKKDKLEFVSEYSPFPSGDSLTIKELHIKLNEYGEVLINDEFMIPVNIHSKFGSHLAFNYNPDQNIDYAYINVNFGDWRRKGYDYHERPDEMNNTPGSSYSMVELFESAIDCFIINNHVEKKDIDKLKSDILKSIDEAVENKKEKK
jgi:hypothetical protein